MIDAIYRKKNGLPSLKEERLRNMVAQPEEVVRNQETSSKVVAQPATRATVVVAQPKKKKRDRAKYFKEYRRKKACPKCGHKFART